MNQFWFLAIVLYVILQVAVAPPVDPKKPSESEHDGNDVASSSENEDLGLEYNRYLKEVVQVLESDPDFRKKLETADQEDIRNGKIAHELDYVHHNIRSKLDELKRQEMERLRHFAMQEYERSQGMMPAHNRLKIPGHIDHKNPMTFEIEDLRKLIVQTTRDLEVADRQRKEEFKQYEMQKEFEHNEKLKLLDEEKKKAEEKAWEESQNKHKQHPKLHHPGSKQQLEEVWEQQDHLDAESFDPRTFFALHDLDGNQVWDADEVKALFTKELDKMYDPNAPEDDMKERYEEMERMREHVFNETDVNRDGLISFQEFLEQTKKTEFERDPGWQGLDEQPTYNHEEYMEFERRRQEEIQRLIQQGLLPPHPAMMPVGGPGHLQYGAPPHMPAVHPNAVPQAHQYVQGQHVPNMGQMPLQHQQPAFGNQISPQEASQYMQQQQQPTYGQVPYQVHPQQPQAQQYAPIASQDIPKLAPNQQQQQGQPRNRQGMGVEKVPQAAQKNAPPLKKQQNVNAASNQIPQQQLQKQAGPKANINSVMTA